MFLAVEMVVRETYLVDVHVQLVMSNTLCRTIYVAIVKLTYHSLYNKTMLQDSLFARNNIKYDTLTNFFIYWWHAKTVIKITSHIGVWKLIFVKY